jgi:hypothetical protein
MDNEVGDTAIDKLGVGAAVITSCTDAVRAVMPLALARTVSVEAPALAVAATFTITDVDVAPAAIVAGAAVTPVGRFSNVTLTASLNATRVTAIVSVPVFPA